MNSIIDLELKFSLQRIKQNINDSVNYANAFLDMMIKNISESVECSCDVDENKIIETLLKKRGYSKNGNLYSRDFVLIQVLNDGKLRIKHDVPQMGNKWQIIDKSCISGLIISLNYYERI